MAVVGDFGESLLFERRVVRPGEPELRADACGRAFSDMGASKQSCQVLAYPFRRRERINFLELHAHRTWAVWTAKSVASWRMRHARLMDSGVVL